VVSTTAACTRPWKTLTKKHAIVQDLGNTNVLDPGFSFGLCGKVPCNQGGLTWHELCNIQSSISGDKECTVATWSPSRPPPPWAPPR
jgi:hypothetical protein